MFQHSDLFMDLVGTRIRVTAGLTRMTYHQAALFNGVRTAFTEYYADAFRPILEAMCSLRQEVLVLRGTETDSRDAHAELVSAGFLTSNQTLVIRLVKDAITLNFGPRAGDNAWEEPLIVTIDRVMEDMTDELQLPDIGTVYNSFDLLGRLVAAGLIEMRDSTHKSVRDDRYVDHPGTRLFRELGLSGEQFLADHVKAKELTELSTRMANRFELGELLDCSKWPLIRDEHDFWKLDISAEGAHVAEIVIDEMALLHTFHPNAYDMRTETVIGQIKEAWQHANK